MATAGQLQMYNKVDATEMFGLDHRARCTGCLFHPLPEDFQIHRVHVYHDEKAPDAVVYSIWLEDHTLGNMLRMELLRNKDVLFAGYKVPHPYNHMIELRVQTLPKSSPEEAVRLAIRNLKFEMKSMLSQFDTQVAKLHAQEAAQDPARARRAPRAPPRRDEARDTDSAAGQTEGVAFDEEGSGVEERSFQAHLEEFERMADHTTTSCSPSPGADGDGDAPMEDA
mmetsp:Transcript_71622/g.184700  ORF Transcript_71622/g.184700 Transcript_71622/m.184700 type:complete len:225 (-) Transcript_71622:4-678(-)